MNKDHIQGTLKVALGSIEERYGQLTGSTRWRLSGVKRQVVGQTQRLVGSAREAMKGATLKR
ncbi:CsbD family protein [Hydrogenophaga sp.]|uniref:CsbD family protein n=1 Tax=Hydrogenophaga sp. TaxID=1904254 RepID=UPI0027308604|nr:CsbD family protein [Hydrogenophaga sp.]MDP2016386.1 CsbD family protein [Hydrogenophaga sp.]MDP3166143.1 CsbD family protein [Hydrogenophaga sp.]MDP3812358.1 CsbD family protein [Hydrogenophaga sp.]